MEDGDQIDAFLEQVCTFSCCGYTCSMRDVLGWRRIFVEDAIITFYRLPCYLVDVSYFSLILGSKC